MNLDGLITRTQVTFDSALVKDHVILGEKTIHGQAFQRVSEMLNRIRQKAGITCFARVESANNFPAGVGIASSASAFAALALAASKAAGLELDEPALSRLARTGSGSACRSIPGGFVEWEPGKDDFSSYAFSLASPNHWALADCIAVVSVAHKPTGSTEGHALADTSPLQASRVQDAPRRLEICRDAILKRDFDALAKVVELDSNMMHAVMMTSKPSLIYWQPATLHIVQQVIAWRSAGLPVCYTIDAGPNVHIICASEYATVVRGYLSQIGVVDEVLVAPPGGPAKLV
jgi:diphosphomevalonate decarboxylase